MRLLFSCFALLLASLVSHAQTVRAPVVTGDTPRAVAVNPVTNTAYVINEFGNSVSVVNGATGAVTATVPVGNRPEYIAVNPQTNRIYVSQGDASLTVIDGNTNTPASYALGSTGPIAINPANGIVYIVRLSSPATDEVTRFDDTGATPTWYSLSTGSFQPMDMTLDPLTNILYVVHYPAGHVRAIDGSSTSDFPPSVQIDVGKPADVIAMNPITNRIYALTENTASPIAIIDGADNSLTTLGPAVTAPKAVAINPVTNKIYAAFDAQVVVLDGATNRMSFVASGTSGSGPVAIGINVVTNKIYVPNADGTLTVIDGDNDNATTLAIPTGATAVAVNPVTNTTYVTTPEGLSIVDGAASDGAHGIPLTTAISQSTTGSSPTFQFTPTTTYSPSAPPVQRVYYRLDSLTGAWQLASGSGTFSGSASNLPAGRHVIYAFAADGQDVPMTGMQSMPVIGAISELAFQVGTAPAKVDPAVTLAVSPNPAANGQSVTLTATVSGSAGAPTGSVTFMDGGAAVAGCNTAAIFNGTATCVTTSIAPGTHSLTAQYGGDASYNAKASAATSLTVNIVKVTPSVALASSLNPSVTGQAISFTASVSGSNGTATGSVTFRDNGTAIAGCAPVALASGNASCTTSALATGSHSVTADYSGDAFYNSAASNTVTQVVNAPSKAAATVSVTSNANPSISGHAVTLQASITGSAGTPTGTAAFLDGGSAISGCGSFTLSGGTASCTTNTLALGNHAITVQYSGDTAYDSATSSPAFTQTVNPPPKIDPTFALTSSINPSSAGQVVTLSVALSGDNGTPTGTATFADGGAAVGACTSLMLSGGMTSCVTSLNAGSHSITVQYSGDNGYNAATSDALVQVVNGRKGIVDFDGDGKADLVMRNDDGSVAVWLMDGVTAKATPTVLGPASGTTIVKAADFDGDGVTDLVRQEADGTTTLYLIGGGTVRDTTVLRPAGTGWHLTHAADFNGDSKADLLWQHDNGAVEMWLMNGTVTASTATIMPAGTAWRVAKIADFNGDGKADLLWANGADASVGMWLMDGTTILQRTPIMGPNNTWTVAGAGDFNADGKADILWRAADGSVGLWLMNGPAQLARRTLVTGNSGWSIARVADVSGDGKADLLWANVDGSVGLWLMDGLDLVQRSSLLGPGTGWSSSGALDTNGDGQADLAWTHSSGAVGLWLMNGTTVMQRGSQLPAGSPWHLIDEQVEVNAP
ncbi:MAG TPA: Ig-like domain repeat protein [Usitatibacter sp.]|jgi:YVTN family beta-propeller protein|nr:Ig-like domain repeat protein [Usitatibacter sp.]